jgi:membrane dipeptidase
MIPYFDGHNDTLLKLMGLGVAEPERLFFDDGIDGGHLDLPKARKGGFVGGFFAMFPPSDGDPMAINALMQKPEYAIPLPPGLPLGAAQATTVAMAAILRRIERRSAGAFRVCVSTADIRAAITAEAIAAVFHIEGAEAIDADLQMLELLYAGGLRSLGIVWSRANIFATGAAFRFPADAELGPGLTDAGRALVRTCNDLGILIDLSHLNAQGFRDVAALSTAPLVATHSNVAAICRHSRNLLDWQFAAIRESGGVVGLNFATSFLRPDGQMDPETSLDVLARHLDAMLEALGEDGVAIGSDFDGALVPTQIGDISGMPALWSALAAKGYGEGLIRKIAAENWLDVLARTIDGKPMT